MRNTRNAAIGYATSITRNRAAKRSVRRRARDMMSTVRGRSRPRRRRILPLVGGAAAAVAGAGVIAMRRHQSAAGDR